ncbi:MAG TPA: hypothetical protein VKQ54_06380 [Caulobacteraceae bacterium]|nr:hypothetical protein [Caulobacteraceae bacterium]
MFSPLKSTGLADCFGGTAATKIGAPLRSANALAAMSSIRACARASVSMERMSTGAAAPRVYSKFGPILPLMIA